MLSFYKKKKKYSENKILKIKILIGLVPDQHLIGKKENVKLEMGLSPD